MWYLNEYLIDLNNLLIALKSDLLTYLYRFQIIMKHTFKLSLLATSIAISLSPTLLASIVRGDVDYQYFRDLAENKGKFLLGQPIFQLLIKRAKTSVLFTGYTN